MSKIANQMSVVDQVAFNIIKKDSTRIKIGENINVKNKLSIDRIQEIFEERTVVYITQDNIQYIFENQSIQTILSSLIKGKDLHIPFKVFKVRFFCSECGGIGVLDWIKSVKKDGKTSRIVKNKRKNSKIFNVCQNYFLDFIIRSTKEINEQDKDLYNLCTRCKGSGIEPTPREKIIDTGTLKEIYEKYIHKVAKK